jgi:acyl-CoA hydrolase
MLRPAPRQISAEDLDFAGIVRPGDVVVCGGATSEPRTLTEELMAQQDRLPPLRVFLGPVYSTTFAAARAPDMVFSSYGVIGNSRALARTGRLDIVPSGYGALCADFASGRHRADVVLLQVSSRATARGFSTSLANDYALAAARHARVVVVEVNDEAPWTFGAEWPADLKPDIQVTSRLPPLELAAAGGDAVSERIAAHAASLVPDAATLQFGVGRIPEAILSNLGHLKNLGIHSGLINDAVVDLVASGAITNTHKGIDAGISVTNQVIGTRKLYDYVHDNPDVSVRPASYTHGHQILAQVRRLVAINSAIEVGLDGSINSETLEGVAVGAIGGQVDFVRGANASPGGRAIIALPAVSSAGTSRIVARVDTVTTPRCDADAIVTEWGVAELRGCDLRERARRMIAIAAPEFREALSRQAYEAAPREQAGRPE